ncbi:MAG: hypothetical protein A3K19_13905 [Lentisphaerae bacterium RIFOXYB12_FULL_65_16]|nr:MAG: hypothetical protein A3K18_18040 [Lentisphaerae bacterium RIFOXYA12_64_32]OGV94130.1 MAG: hypothetical protein A3K19_13905 [Lentisphaerae bacterium RIFOXYB12_FULL_65_16]
MCGDEMTDLARVQAWFESGELVQPRAEALNFVDLVRAIGRLCGAAELASGPGELSPATAARMGSFIGIAPQPCKLYIEPCAGCHVEYLGVHGGLRPAEMTVPLVLV